MKVSCEVELDLDTKEYSLKFHTNPAGSEVDLYELKDMLKKVFQDVDKQIEENGVDSTDDFLKQIH